MTDLTAWLSHLGLGQYAEIFRDNDIDQEILAELDENDLKELGISSLGHRKKLLKAIAALVSEEVAMPVATPATPSLEAERRQLTVMFVDLVGSTELSTRLDPEDLRELILAYQNTVAGEITRFEGFIARYMGDGVLAYFGWPRAHEDEAERAVRAALAIITAVSKLTTTEGAALATRIGIATGLVVVGDLIGEGAAQEHPVVGETPNLAARLQSLAEPNTVVISNSTRQLLGEVFDLQSLGPQTLKGITKSVTVYTVLRERALTSRFEARSGPAPSPMVGRDQELALLLERWTQAKAGEGQGVLLIAEAGIGKSRICEALIEAVADEPHRRIRYQCSPYHSDSTLWPVIQQLTHVAGLIVTDPNETRLDKLEKILLAQSGEGATAAPLIAALLGLEGNSRYGPLNLTPQAQRTRTLEALIGQLLNLAAQQPVLLVLEDAHWIDPTTLELIEQCLDRISNARVLILLTSRPDRQPELSAHPHVTRLILNRLGRVGVEAIITRLGGDRLTTGMVDAIVERTDGVPLFVEELTKAILETGETTLPASLHDSLIARLDRIPEVKEVSQIAACIGRVFDYSLLAVVAEKPETELVAALDKLVTAELVFRRGVLPEATYTFKHALVRDAAYGSLLKATRRGWHERIAQVLQEQEQFALIITSEPELLAHHYTEAGNTQQAIDYWQRAGQRALKRLANVEAVNFLKQGLRMLDQLPGSQTKQHLELKFLLALNPALMASKGTAHDETLSIAARACTLCEQLEESELLITALFSRFSVHMARAELEKALPIAKTHPVSGQG